MSEHLKYLGRRAELNLEKKNLEIRINGLVQNLRDELDPLCTPDKLQANDILTHVLDLVEAKERYVRVMDDLARILDILGR